MGTSGKSNVVKLRVISTTWIVIHFIKHPHGVNSRDFFEGNMVATECLGPHLNMFGLKIESCAFIEDKNLTHWTHSMDRLF